ncbi:hypothetical protein ELI25_17755 [Rhizobium ruizarguesonis]|nr:hypothetical protein ELI25_17755 [Rhizobium ruizarguesonis]TAZ53063.1 hypothetical protein ELH76_18760 [Rhizobium ruizarguesonis]
MKSGRVLFGKTPPQPLPTRGRGLSAEFFGNLATHPQRWKENSPSAAGLPLPLVGRGWGGV